METWEWDHVDGQLPQVGVELTREVQAGWNTGHFNRHEMFEIAVCRGRQLEGTEADIVQSLFVDTERLAGVLDEPVDREGGVVRLDVGTTWVSDHEPQQRYRRPWKMGRRSGRPSWYCSRIFEISKVPHPGTGAIAEGVSGLEP